MITQAKNIRKLLKKDYHRKYIRHKRDDGLAWKLEFDVNEVVNFLSSQKPRIDLFNLFSSGALLSNKWLSCCLIDKAFSKSSKFHWWHKVYKSQLDSILNHWHMTYYSARAPSGNSGFPFGKSDLHSWYTLKRMFLIWGQWEFYSIDISVRFAWRLSNC